IIAGLLFKKYGSAGGHRTMAKAVIKLDQMKKELGINSLDQVRTTIWWIFQELEDGSPGFFTS
ncbi:MAG: hypothetical protein OEZ04_13130, partial [Nitrospinota bacterium]|nr:hypothetical protein [Nitrospinota bacterium]